MTDNSVTISLPEMLDLALSSPEVGAVNFNILHSLLHVIIKQINLSNLNIKFNDADGERIQNLMHNCPIEATVNITECILDDSKIPVEQPVSEDKTVLVETVPVQEIKRRKPHDFFDRELAQLKEDIKTLKDLPSNPELIEALRGQNDKPILDMYRLLALSKRMDASEQGLRKIASLFEDFVKGQTNCCSKLDERMGVIENNSSMTGRDQIERQLANLRDKLAEYADQASLMDTTFRHELDQLREYLNDLEKDIGEIIDNANQVETLDNRDLFNTVMEIQEELLQLSKSISDLWKGKDDHQSHLDTLIEEIELVKIIKANKEDLADALADKASICALNKKVSINQFEATCDELLGAIQEIHLRLQQQECVWKQALTDIENEMKNKLNNDELTALVDFIREKLRILQNQIKDLAASKNESEAAGTKQKYLKDLECISCGNKVSMCKDLDPSLFNPPPGLKPHAGFGPYIAYELDQIRHHRRDRGKNANYQETSKATITDADSEVCHRYCGGSHTTTTPQQRVHRMGNFLDQWSCEMIPELETNLVGTDGHIYQMKETITNATGNKSITESMVVKSEILIEHCDTKIENTSTKLVSSKGSRKTK